MNRGKGLGRGKPLERKTPLKVKQRMAAGKGLPQSRPLSAAKPIRPKRDTPRRKSRNDAGHGMPWADVRLVIFARALGRCEACGRQLNIANMEGHHRRTRAVGPDCPGNAVALCRDCHHDDVHGKPAWARARGLIVSKFVDDPCSQPAWLHGHGWVTLGCGGTVAPAEAPS